MVVRETPSLADSVAELLSSEGYRVRSVASAEKARQVLASPRGRGVRAAVIVCNQPFCTGPDTLACADADIPIIVLGWRGAPEHAQRNSKLLLLRLPISAGMLLENLRTVVGDGYPPAVPAAG